MLEHLPLKIFLCSNIFKCLSVDILNQYTNKECYIISHKRIITGVSFKINGNTTIFFPPIFAKTMKQYLFILGELELLWRFFFTVEAKMLELWFVIQEN